MNLTAGGAFLLALVNSGDVAHVDEVGPPAAGYGGRWAHSMTSMIAVLLVFTGSLAADGRAACKLDLHVAPKATSFDLSDRGVLSSSQFTVTITNTVADLTGRPPRTLAEFVREHASVFS